MKAICSGPGCCLRERVILHPVAGRNPRELRGLRGRAVMDIDNAIPTHDYQSDATRRCSYGHALH